MKKLTCALLSLCLLFTCTCCTPEDSETTADYSLYFLVSGDVTQGSALDTQPYLPTNEDEVVDPGVLIAALLGGPTAEGLSSPFPRGVTLESWRLDGTTGNLVVGLSEQYGGLTDISLTLADYCLVLTLCQLEDVSTVEILSAGRTANYRSHQILQESEALLDDSISPST